MVTNAFGFLIQRSYNTCLFIIALRQSFILFSVWCIVYVTQHLSNNLLHRLWHWSQTEFPSNIKHL